MSPDWCESAMKITKKTAVSGHVWVGSQYDNGHRFLDPFCTPLPGPDPDRILDRENEYLAVADLAGVRGGLDNLYNFFRRIIGAAVLFLPLFIFLPKLIQRAMKADVDAAIETFGKNERVKKVFWTR